MKTNKYGFGHMTDMAAMAIYGKNHLKNLLQNQWTNCFENWYVILGSQGPS